MYSSCKVHISIHSYCGALLAGTTVIKAFVKSPRTSLRVFQGVSGHAFRADKA